MIGRGWLAAILLLGCAAAAAAKPFVCPRTGGDFVFGLDRLPDREIVMNTQEALIARDEANRPVLDLASAMTESADHLRYTFTLRAGIAFHNGKPLTSTDVAASFDRYARSAAGRTILDGVAGWDTPDPTTFVIRLHAPGPVFIEALSGFAAPVAIVPAEDRDSPSPPGTGPFRYQETGPDGSVVLRRNDAYQPNPAFADRTGFGGRKLACLNSVTFRPVMDPGDRAEGLKAGELHAVEDLPPRFLPDLKKDPDLAILPMRHWWIQIAIVNVSAPPTDNVLFRRAIQAALDMDEIMDAATGGEYSLNAGFQYPNQPAYSEAGKDTYNIKDPERAKALLTGSGYGGETVVLLTNKDDPPMYNAALVAQQQLQAIGINAELKVVDRATSIQMARQSATGWNVFFTAWGMAPAQGALAAMRLLADPNTGYRPLNSPGDPGLLSAWADMTGLPDPAGRQAAFARMQAIALDQVYAIPFGTLTKIQGTRANVRGFAPFRIPRLFNVWFAE